MNNNKATAALLSILNLDDNIKVHKVQIREMEDERKKQIMLFHNARDEEGQQLIEWNENRFILSSPSRDITALVEIDTEDGSIQITRIKHINLKS